MAIIDNGFTLVKNHGTLNFIEDTYQINIKAPSLADLKDWLEEALHEVNEVIEELNS